ncbi:hypothetical protein T484DRAFT_1817706, partial [Baffinella frigidus]
MLTLTRVHVSQVQADLGAQGRKVQADLGAQGRKVREKAPVESPDRISVQGRKVREKAPVEKPERVSVQVIGAELNPDVTGKDAPDTSVVLMCGEKSVETKITYGSAKPDWNERFQLILQEDRQVEEMVAVVFVATDSEPEVLGIVRARFDLLKDESGYDDR